MAKGSNQKLKLLYLAKILASETDEEHGISVSEIIRRLGEHEISAERKAIYQDIVELQQFGMDISSRKEGKNYLYYLVSRDFEIAELKLLVDSVQSSRFITEKKSKQLIEKLESLLSIHDAKKLNRQVVISGRVKTMNESIYYNVDSIHDAINSDSRIRFQYFQWNVNKEPELRHDGAWYDISPWGLVWDNENYYLIGYDGSADRIKHFRVDKMLHITATSLPREGRTLYERQDPAHYTKAVFGMFGGEPVKAALLCDNDLVGAILDRFGDKTMIMPVDKEHFRVYVDVVPSLQFYGWVFALGDGIKLEGPADVVEKLKSEAERLVKQYT